MIFWVTGNDFLRSRIIGTVIEQKMTRGVKSDLESRALAVLVQGTVFAILAK